MSMREMVDWYRRGCPLNLGGRVPKPFIDQQHISVLSQALRSYRLAKLTETEVVIS